MKNLFILNLLLRLEQATGLIYPLHPDQKIYTEYVLLLALFASQKDM